MSEGVEANMVQDSFLEKEGIILGVINDVMIDQLKQAHVFNLTLGNTKQVKKGENLISLGANPCLTGVVIDENDDIQVFHTLKELFVDGQWKLIERAKWGIIGGGPFTLESCLQALKKTKVIPILTQPQYANDSSFNVAVVRNTLIIPQGIYYGYIK